MATSYGVMQGRLSPPHEGRFQSFPRSSWREEIARARAAGLDYIEWIFDEYGSSANPLSTPAGVAELNALKSQHGIETPALCGDWFMDFPFVRCTPEERKERETMLTRLLRLAPAIGAERLVVPFVDQSRLATEGDQDIAVAVVERALPAAREAGVELHLETDLRPADFAKFLTRLPDPLVKVNYDTGNSSGLGYVPSEEFAAYGDRIGSIHIKDRLRKPDGGVATMPLGQGSADFDDFFVCLRRSGYAKGLTLQVARGQDGAEVEWIRGQLAFVQRRWPKDPHASSAVV
ncbi:MAG: sugar phosphate isomerase/epimerase [Acidobacteriaceae bacterium]